MVRQRFAKPPVAVSCGVQVQILYSPPMIPSVAAGGRKLLRYRRLDLTATPTFIWGCKQSAKQRRVQQQVRLLPTPPFYIWRDKHNWHCLGLENRSPFLGVGVRVPLSPPFSGIQACPPSGRPVDSRSYADVAQLVEHLLGLEVLFYSS